MLEAKTILELTEKIYYKSPHLANHDRKYLDNNDKNTKMPYIKHIIPISHFSISEYIISTQLMSGIQSIWSRFKSI